MKFMENTKSYFGERAIRKYLKSHKRIMASCSMDEAKTVGILFDATQPISFEIIKELVKSISGKKITIDVLGFVDSKQLIDQYLYRKGFDFFTRSQLNWYHKPNNPSVDTFIAKPFDLLLDLSLDNPYPIRYITICSAARFKAGRYYKNHDYLDLMIDIEKEKQNMSSIQHELEKDLNKNNRNNKEVERIIDKKVQTEIQLNFLINQLIHYLSLLKK
jgi:hypothetical protein